MEGRGGEAARDQFLPSVARVHQHAIHVYILVYQFCRTYMYLFLSMTTNMYFTFYMLPSGEQEGGARK